MKIACKQSNICIKSNNPQFKYKFAKAGVPLEVEEAHVEKVLANGDFYESDKPLAKKEDAPKKENKDKSWHDELTDINGIGDKTAKDIMRMFPERSNLLEALAKGGELPFDDDVAKKLSEVFIH